MIHLKNKEIKMFQALKLKKKNGIFDVMGKVYKNNIF